MSEIMIPAVAENAARPVLLLVHGAWVGAWSWEKVQPELIARGWEVQTVDLPSVADLGGPRFGLHDDAAVVRKRVREIGRPVVVVAHSYGGAVATQAAGGLTNVQHIVYVCGFVLDIGESLIQLSGRVPWWNVDGDTMTTHDTREVLFTGVPQEDSDRAIARLRPFTYAAVSETLAAAAWRSVPSTYILCENDMALPSQDAFASRTTRVRRLPTGHMPLLSMPLELTDLIVEAAESA
jgi:pimeloyl-ACP methyl ester carboxylesterase